MSTTEERETARLKFVTAIIKYMRFKDRVIKRAIGGDPRYFTERDENIISKWSYSRSKEVYDYLRIRIDRFYVKRSVLTDARPLDAAICPFCVLFYDAENECPKCPYKIEHSCCLYDASDYARLTSGRDGLFGLFGDSQGIGEMVEIFGLE